MLIQILKWTAWISGALVIVVILIAITQIIIGVRAFEISYQSVALFAGLLLGLSMAYKWPLLGGSIATLGLLVSKFLHPLILIPGILYLIYGIIIYRKANN